MIALASMTAEPVIVITVATALLALGVGVLFASLWGGLR